MTAPPPPPFPLTTTPLQPTPPFTSTLRYPGPSRKSIYDRNLSRTFTHQVSLSTFAHLFNTLITYHHTRSGSVAEIETRLNRAGYPLGLKLLDLHLHRSQGRTITRPTRILDVLQFIHTTLWRALFARAADALEQSNDKKNEYMIVDNEPVVNTYISTPKEISQLNCAAFVAGIIEGVCDAAGLEMEGVSAHWAGGEKEEMWPGKTIFLLRFSQRAVEREEAIKAGGG
ncbi:unnamed protein product [Zymoseptoria tritici ST99CH_1A5]|uniref:Trafficking protein particle complex subunit n=3 Tax=Zymoseptoria tritici TaxID=1047171 RepID=A0A1X7RKT1_ZYMT9|nr:unnamed protein product [Zymoseptoria tritici ST99CH_3D7]SMR46578.1 unnamed protein product [Zymoseptoria tritici ST99CH_1E4]SMY21727.1 unnamed protein product [Zymoseptoria tritici ST99CH_1A5]